VKKQRTEGRDSTIDSDFRRV